MIRREERLMEYLPWAQRFARTCTANLPSHLDHDNLHGAGLFGYLRAAARYDISRGASFRGFCATRIRGAILDELRRWDWAPRSVHKNQRRISIVTRELTEQLEREPTQKELAKALGMEPADLNAYQTQSQPRQMISLDEIAEKSQGEEGLSLAERLADAQATAPDVAILASENRMIILRCLKDLPKTQATVIVLHYLHNIPLRDVASVLGVTPSRVSQLHHQALGRMKVAWKRLHAHPRR
jgi:RNA polymerase sigma factor for flagellar operon FliA